MRRACALTAVAAVLMLAACDSESAAGPTTLPPSSSGSSGTTSDPTTPSETGGSGAAPMPPVMPALAKQKSRAGAKAFVRHYIGLINYSWRTGSGASLRYNSAAECGECQSLANSIDEFEASGGFQRGGAWIAKRLFAIPTTPVANQGISATIKVTEGRWRRSVDDRIHHISRATVVTDFFLVWQSGRWLVADVDQS